MKDVQMYTPTALIIPEKFSRDRFEKEVLPMVGTAGKGGQWWVGDAYITMFKRYGLRTRTTDGFGRPTNEKVTEKMNEEETLTRFLSITGLTRKSVQNIVSVCRGIATERRREDVSFSLHSELVSESEHMQSVWLARCAENDWTREELRAAIKASRKTAVVVRPTITQPVVQLQTVGGNGGTVSLPVNQPQTPVSSPTLPQTPITAEKAQEQGRALILTGSVATRLYALAEKHGKSAIEVAEGILTAHLDLYDAKAAEKAAQAEETAKAAEVIATVEDTPVDKLTDGRFGKLDFAENSGKDHTPKAGKNGRFANLEVAA